MTPNKRVSVVKRSLCFTKRFVFLLLLGGWLDARIVCYLIFKSILGKNDKEGRVAIGVYEMRHSSSTGYQSLQDV
jgi:hypothetical protein